MHSSPLVQREVINGYSLLYTIKGSSSSLKPYLLISHLDVVPVKDQVWNAPHFKGLVKDGYIWGRGTLDVKNGVMVCILIRCFDSFAGVLSGNTIVSSICLFLTLSIKINTFDTVTFCHKTNIVSIFKALVNLCLESGYFIEHIILFPVLAMPLTAVLYTQ